MLTPSSRPCAVIRLHDISLDFIREMLYVNRMRLLFSTPDPVFRISGNRNIGISCRRWRVRLARAGVLARALSVNSVNSRRREPEKARRNPQLSQLYTRPPGAPATRRAIERQRSCSAAAGKGPNRMAPGNFRELQGTSLCGISVPRDQTGGAAWREKELGTAQNAQKNPRLGCSDRTTTLSLHHRTPGLRDPIRSEWGVPRQQRKK